ncbi:HTH domain-containing protein [Caballeronia sp. ATUFL_M1_KS5A]|uniref:IclR family transcriptional regulator n=1 Tax=Caballeronia sp. ATUFL_M1_KS5A TaxID=2921778 RepID=UPI00202954EB|nr:HTH domain-containing protein [Caballeronia sp. ATUFL_M1_KS5A]
MNRLLLILEAFRLDRPVVSLKGLMLELGVSRATVYRDLQQLEEGGYIDRLGQGYVLGPRILQMERQFRHADPLLLAARELCDGLARDSDGAVLLCRLHQHTAVCIYDISRSGERMPLGYERGRATTLCRGATSKVILSHMSRRSLEALIGEHPDAVTSEGLPTDSAELYRMLSPVREAGYVIARGDIDESMVELAVPLMTGKRLLGSLTVALTDSRATATAEARALNLLRSIGRRIEARMETVISRASNMGESRSNEPEDVSRQRQLLYIG